MLCCLCAVALKEVYFVAPTDQQLTNNYFYYMTSNTSRDRGSHASNASSLDHVVGGRVDAMSRLRQLTVTESLPASLHCIAAGGYPAPRLRMLVGDRDVTERFRRKSTWTLRGVVGMRVIDIRSELYSTEWTVDADDDDAIVRCTAFVDRHLGEQFAAISLLVRRMYVTYYVIIIIIVIRAGLIANRRPCSNCASQSTSPPPLLPSLSLPSLPFLSPSPPRSGPLKTS